MPSEQLDIDAAYDDALANVRERRPIAEKPVNENTVKEDYYREIRTRLVLIWIVSNAVLAMALTEVYSTGLSGTNGYLKCENIGMVFADGSHPLGNCGIVCFSIYWIKHVFVDEHRSENGSFEILSQACCLSLYL